MQHPARWPYLFAALWVVGLGAVGCQGSVGSSGPATGGAPGAGGVVASGGNPGNGNAGSGGAVATGGRIGNGTATGGAVATGGAANTGGTTGTGGSARTGGASGTGGAAGAGGRGPGATGGTGVGGTTGVGGATGAQPFKGVANAACADLTTLKVAWYYNWTLSPGSCTASQFVPMIAGKSEKTAAAVTSALTQIANAGYKTVLGFNEPNKVDQSNLTVAQVLAMWPALTANPAIRVGSPATSADAQAWFTDFMTQATAQNLRIDFIALHWYGWNAGSCDANAVGLENYIKWAEAIPGNRPLWITEWGCLNQSNPDPATVQAFFTGALAMFARHPRIERHAWYPWTMNNELVGTGGVLTPLGTALANAPALR